MIRKRILSLLVCAALLCGVLAGCSTSSGSTAASSSSASASESIPSSTVTADTGKVGPLDAGENSLFSLSGPGRCLCPLPWLGPRRVRLLAEIRHRGGFPAGNGPMAAT